MKRNSSHMVKIPNHPRVKYHECGDCDVLDSILSRPKRQPDTNWEESSSAKTDPASNPSAFRPDASDPSPEPHASYAS